LIFEFISKPYLLCLEFLLMLACMTSRPSFFTLLAASDASKLKQPLDAPLRRHP